jgi:hypothetical protein
MRVQHYGATSRRKGTEYLAQCRKLLRIEEAEANAAADTTSKTADDDQPFELVNESEAEEKPYEPTWKCTKCGKQMQCLEFQHRPSWKIVLADFLPKTSDEIQATLWTEEELRSLRDSAIPESQSAAPHRELHNENRIGVNQNPSTRAGPA